MKTSHVQVTLRFRKTGEAEWYQENISTQKYFDLEPNEVADVGSIPRFNHAIDYIGLHTSEVANTQIRIVDTEVESSIVITETFWNNGNNRIIERVDASPTSSYWE